MTTLCRGLRPRNDIGVTVPNEGKLSHKENVAVNRNAKLISVDKNLKSPKTSISNFKIYHDPVHSICQHCGGSRDKISKNYVSVGIQADTSDLHQILCNDYWKDLAEQRRVALAETLDENKELCNLVEKLNAEINRLSLIAKHAEQFATMYNLTKEQNLGDTIS